MKDFFNKIYEFITSFIKFEHFLLIIGFLLIFVAILLIIHANHHKRINILDNSVLQEHNTYYLSVDLINKTVYQLPKVEPNTALDISLSISPDKGESLNTYLDRFDEKSRNTIYRWFNSQINNSNTIESNLELTVVKNKNYCHELFVCRQVNPTKQRLYLSNLSVPLQGKKGESSPYLKADTEIERLHFKVRKKSLIYVGLIDFFPLERYENLEDYHFDLFYQRILLNIVLEKCKKNHYCSYTKDGKIILIITNYQEDDSFVDEIHLEFQRFFEINSIRLESFHIVYDIKTASQLKMKETLNTLHAFSIYQLNNHLFDQAIYRYNANTSPDITVHDLLLKDISETILTNNMSYHYDAILSTRTAQLDGYNITILPKMENAMNEATFLKNIANLDKSYDYFITVLNSIIAQYKNEPFTKRKPSKKIVLHILPSMLPAIKKLISFFKRKSNEEFTFIFEFNLSDIVYQIEKTTNFYDEVSTLIKKNIDNLQFRFKIDCFEPISNNLLDLTDCFTIDADFFKTEWKEIQSRRLLTYKLKKLNEIKKSIVANGVTDWMTYETLLCHHATYLTGPITEANNTLNAAVVKRISSRIRDLYSKYY